MVRLATLVAVLVALPLAGCGPSETQAAAGDAASERTTRSTATSGMGDRDGGGAAGVSEARGWQTEPITDPVQQDLLREVLALRDRIEVFARHKGRTPDLAGNQWRDLLAGGYVDATPQNPLSPDRVAAKILVTDIPGATGSGVHPAAVGWVWNRADGRLFAAGLPDAELP